MNIAVKGQAIQIEELQAKLGAQFTLSPLKITELSSYDVVFDLDFDDDPEHLESYGEQSDLLVVIGAVKVQLEELPAVLGRALKCTLIGMNCLPTFINRSLVEVSVMSASNESKAKALAEKLGWELRFVNSRIGMVTPRIVCMIINEAFFTVQEGTATAEDIDLGMKLGTAYPKGPFEWCEQIGIINVYEVLNAMYEDTHDERYKICPALKTAYLKAMAS
ncbi:MAG: 3-hydroxyacyl-CoA dehydrogenase [Bacteroidia bacterium]